MPDALRPRQLRDVHEPLDARLDLDEGTVRHEVDDLALDARADRILRVGVVPGAGQQLLQSERNLARLAVHGEHDDVQLLANLQDVRRVPDAAPRDVADVQQPVHPAQINEGAEVCQVLHGAGPALPNRERLDELRTGAFLLADEVVPVGDDDVLPGAGDLQDDELQPLADETVEVGVALEGGERGRHEGLHADVHHEAALHLADGAALDGVAFLIVVDDAVPALLPVGLDLGEDDHALLILDIVDEDFHLVADLQGVAVAELRAVDGPLRLEADVDEDVLGGQGHDFPLHDLALGDAAQTLGVELLQLAGGAGRRCWQRF